ncbi:MAG: aspartyl protease family protein [Polyangia bacterium]
MSALTIGGVTFHDFFNELGTGLPLLGADVFGKFATRFDYRDKEIRFAPSEPPAGVAPPIERAFELEGGGETKTSFGVRYFAATRIFVSVEVEGRALTLLLDTGADVVYLRRQTFDALVGDGRKTLSITAAAAGGAVDTEVARTSSVRVYGEEVSDAFISYVDEGRIDELAKEAGRPVDGLLGAAFLRHFAIDIDYPRRTLALHRYLDDSQLVDPYARVGIELRGSSSVHPYEIATVYAGTDAASKGLKPGDVLLTIDELDLDQANLDPFAAMRALRGPIGTLHQLTTTTGVFSVAVDQLL